jgi:hypothetical protein
MAFHAIDGMLAREHQMANTTGAILNEALDLLSEAALTLPFATVAGERGWHLACHPRRDSCGSGWICHKSWLGFGWPWSNWIADCLSWAWLGLCAVTVVNRLRKLTV